MSIAREDLIWLAGLAEGEATFDCHRGRYPRIRIGMTDRDVVGRAATVMGAGIRLSLRPAPNASMWHTEISGPRAAEIMWQILPFMGARRSSKIAEVLSVVAMARPGASATCTPGPRLTRPPGITVPAPSPKLPAVATV